LAQLYPRALGSPYVATYDSQSYIGGILIRLHTGIEVFSLPEDDNEVKNMWIYIPIPPCAYIAYCAGTISLFLPYLVCGCTLIALNDRLLEKSDLGERGNNLGPGAITKNVGYTQDNHGGPRSE
jgi:hypothetical protein